ncbi:MAG: hypothetical protein P1V97_30335 [Planctomycetota bacterium]|nr:hypothetical protein [Planctomycetota bacterium]
MFFEYAAPFQKSSRVTKRGLPAQDVLENTLGAIGQGRHRSYRGLLRELKRIRELGSELTAEDSNALRVLVLNDDPRIWRQAALLDKKTQRLSLKRELANGQMTLGDYFTLVERLGFLSLEDLPLLLSCLTALSGNLAQKARRLLAKLDVQVVGQCLLALRSEDYDALSIIDFLADLGADATFARSELAQRLERWACPLDEQAALTYALSQIPERDSVQPIAASLNHKEAA